MTADTKAHTVEDHLYGQMLDHEHGPDADHDHDNFDAAGPLDENPIWLQDNVFLTSVGLDVGSSGTQVIFSHLQMRRISERLTSRYVVVARETVHESPVALTPYTDAHRIDSVALGRIVDEAYAAARLTAEDIDTGVVILTGEALRRENAEAIAHILAEQGGEFVCATAGHHMEAMLAAYGSGAAQASHAEGKRLLNIDIGGGTTKLAIVEHGAVVGTGAIHVGGRLLVADGEGRITRLDPAGRHHARRAGFDWNEGAMVTPEELEITAGHMADLLVSAITAPELDDAVLELYLTEPIRDFGRIDGIMVSGGVGEFVYGRETRDFGDLGSYLGRALRARLDRLPWEILPAGACIRATALGASEYTVQLSGNTSYISDRGRLLPRRDLQVLQPDIVLPDSIRPGEVAGAIRHHLLRFDLVGEDRDIAFAFRWSGLPEYGRLRAFAEGIAEGVAERSARGLPLYLMLDGDVARTLGLILREELGLAIEIMAIDGLELHDFDYIDLGRVRLPSGTVPVTIKSLLFRDKNDQRIHYHDHDDDHDHNHHHHHDHDHHHHGGHHHHHHHDHGHHHHGAWDHAH